MGLPLGDRAMAIHFFKCHDLAITTLGHNFWSRAHGHQTPLDLFQFFWNGDYFMPTLWLQSWFLRVSGKYEET